MGDPKYIIGIDLGTTHCVLSYAPIQEKPEIKVFDILQIVDFDEMKSLPLLPSFIFIPSDLETSRGDLRMHWQSKIEYIIGEFARKRGSEIPHRLVASAKSWLCNNGVDRTQPILPWESPKDVKKLSPVEATSLLLRYMKEAWNYFMAKDSSESTLENQDIYITVPASFDAVARELTVQAARMAGIENFTLLEEPQAAFYGWLYFNEKSWRDLVKVGDIVLVCDVGGGTTDFSLIEVSEEDGSLLLKRIAVGDHILLGGDNMDLTLAYLLRQKISSKLDEWQFRMLTYQSRIAKEKLLAREDLQSVPVVILGRGTSLIGGVVKTELTREEVQRILVDGFFPLCDIEAKPQKKAKIGVREMGLPYEEDPAITKHMASFVSKQLKQIERFPSAVLFNGGVMKASIFRQRVLEVVQSWNKEKPVRELASPDLELSVSKGATYYGFAKRGKGIRIRAGAPVSYYIAIESAMPAVPGIPAPMKALCVVPFGMEEGTSVEIREKEFGLIVGEPAIFKLMASSVRQKDQVGDIIEDWEKEIRQVATMETLLTSDQEEVNLIPVWLESSFTEIGTLELRCVDINNPQRKWKLEFNLKEQQLS